MRKAPLQELALIVPGIAIGVLGATLVRFWSVSPTLVRVILIVAIILLLALPWLPTLDLRDIKHPKIVRD